MSYWEDKPGSTRPTNWFKEHPRATLVLLLLVAGILVLVSL